MMFEKDGMHKRGVDRRRFLMGMGGLGLASLVSLPAQATDNLRTTQLYSVFDIHEDEESALDRFGTD